MNKTSFLLVATAVLVFFTQMQAQEPKPVPPERITRVIEVKYAEPAQLADLLLPFTRNSPTQVVPNNRFGTLTLSGSPSTVSAMEEIVRRFDVAPPKPKNIEVTAYLLGTSEGGSSSQTIPAQLEPVLKQLRSTFAYKSYQLLETIVTRSSLGQVFPGPTVSDGFISDPSALETRIPYTFKYQGCRLIHDDKGDSILFEDMSLNLDFKETGGPTATSTKTRGFRTSLNLRPGQMVVVGKTNFQVGNSALIAVITAKVTE